MGELEPVETVPQPTADAGAQTYQTALQGQPEPQGTTDTETAAAAQDDQQLALLAPAEEQTPETAEIVRLTEELTGHQAESVAYATEAPFLSSLGMDVVVLGPGSIDQAHQPDEYLPMNQIKPAIEIIQGLIKRFCAS